MAKLTINPADVIDYKTPLYKEDREAKKVYRLLPETTADQVKYANGQNGEAVKSALESGIAGAQWTASSALAAANSASASAEQANQTASSALATANNAKGAADGVKAQVDNAATGLAATKAIADAAMAAAVVMRGATQNADGEKGLVPRPAAGSQGKYLRGDGTWQTPPDTTYSNMTGASLLASGAAGLVPAPPAGHSNRFLCSNGLWGTPYYPVSGASINLYISKSGNDNNSGLTVSDPVLTFNKAIDIANYMHFTRPDGFISFCVGAGDWGNINFYNIPYIFRILPYSGTAATAYSDELPKFGELRFYGCTIHLVSIVANYVGASQCTFCSLEPGYKRIGRLQVWRNSLIMVAYSDADTNVWEIKGGNEADYVIQVEETSTILVWRCHIKLSKNVTGNFINLRENCEFTVDYRTDFLSTACGVSGAKVDAWRNSFITTFESPGVYAWLNRIPGTGAVNIGDGVFVNGVSTAAATKAWVSQQLGSGASLTALASLDEKAEDYVETLDIRKQKTIAQINAEAQQAIYAGFPYEIDGEEYIIDYSLFDQQNLASRAIAAEQSPDETISLPCRDESGEKVWLEVSAETVKAIQNYGALNHTDAILKMADEKKTRILAAETEEEIKAIYME